MLSLNSLILCHSFVSIDSTLVAPDYWNLNMAVALCSRSSVAGHVSFASASSCAVQNDGGFPVSKFARVSNGVEDANGLRYFAGVRGLGHTRRIVGRREVVVVRAGHDEEFSAESNGLGSSSTPLTKESALILIRHGESLWNSKNLFTGCVDVPLSEKGVNEAIEAGKRISDMPVDLIFTSALIRAQMTAMLAMTQHQRQKVPVILHNESERAEAWSRIFSEGTDNEVIPVVTAWQLNERMYGELQGLNKKETAEKFGDAKVREWRRSYDIPPPNGESLEMCAERAVKYFVEKVVPELAAGKNVMIAAHGNSLRAIIMYLDSLTPQEVIELELTTGIPMLYTFKESKFLRRGSPVGPTVAGVYALTMDLATYRDQSRKDTL